MFIKYAQYIHRYLHMLILEDLILRAFLVSCGKNSNAVILQLELKSPVPICRQFRDAFLHNIYDCSVGQCITAQPVRSIQYGERAFCSCAQSFKGDIEWHRGCGVVDRCLECIFSRIRDASNPVRGTECCVCGYGYSGVVACVGRSSIA